MSTVSEETQEIVPALEPVIPSAPAMEEPELVHEFQPTDELGRALGGKQVIKYRTPAELAEKLTQQNVLLVRKLREETKKQRLGIAEVEELPDDAPRIDGQFEFAPRDLTADERATLSRDLLDPDKFDDAKVKLSEAIWGATPDVLRQRLERVETANQRLQVRLEAEAFVADTPEYFKCQENFETIVNWMLHNDLAPVKRNFKTAYERLDKANLLLRKTEAAPIVEPPLAPAPVEPTLPPAPTIQRAPTGLTRQQAPDIPAAPRSVGDEIVYDRPIKDRYGNLTGKSIRYTGLAAIEAMPSEEFKRRVGTDKTFNQKYEQLLHEQEQRAQQRG